MHACMATIEGLAVAVRFSTRAFRERFVVRWLGNGGAATLRGRSRPLVNYNYFGSGLRRDMHPS